MNYAVVAAVAVGAWLLAYGICRLVTRPASPAPGPATMELGAESPALVSLLVNRWTITEDAAESTLLDLAARRFLELRQPAADPMQTTVHLPAAPPSRSDLRPYERQVLDRIRRLAVGGVVPITALTFRNKGDSRAWNDQLRRAVIAEAHGAGLSRRRISKGMAGLLAVPAAFAAIALGFAAEHYDVTKTGDDRPGIAVGIVAFVALGIFGSRSLGERDTPAGRAVAARWLGVRQWLRGHEQFAELPPAAVGIWDRYLAYGAALGAARLASAVLDLEMGNRRLVWSSFGGTWHRVRVRYPRFWPRYGRTVGHQLRRAVASGLVGFLLLRFVGSDDRVALPALLLLLLGVYLLIRALLDLATTRTLTGEVLWRETWKTKGQGEDEPPLPVLEYLAIDDGSDDRTTAWLLPTVLGGECTDGDTVTVTVRPWTRLIVRLEQVGHGRSRELTPTLTDPGELAAELLPTEEMSAAVFAADDVAGVVGQPVVAAPMPFGYQYTAVQGGRPLLFVQCVSGLPGRVAWRANSRGRELPGGAWVKGDRAAFRRGDTTVVLTLIGDGRAGRDRLPGLLDRVAR